MLQYLKGGYKKDRDTLFTKHHIEKTRCNRYKLNWERFNLNIRNKFVTEKAIINWNNLPRDMVRSPFQNTIRQGAR